jgi:hypothetical protein
MSSGAPVENGTPIRYPSAALLCVDSTDTTKFSAAGFRIDETSPSQIYINNGRPLMFGYMTRVALTEMDVQWDTPNVNSRNNTITMRLFTATNATPNVVTPLGYIRRTIDVDFYTHETLAAEVQAELNDDPLVIANFGVDAFEVDVSSDGGFVFDMNGAGAKYPSGRPKGYFQFVSGDASSSITGFTSLQYDLLYTMGITPKDFKMTIYTGALAPMCYTPYVDVVSNLLTKNQNVTDGTSSKLVTTSRLARIYFSNEQIEDITPVVTTNKDTNFIGTSPCFFRREFKFPKQIQWNTTENIDVIDISVLDFKGNPVLLETVVEDTTPTDDILNLGVYQDSSNTVFRFTVQVTEV